MTANEDLAMASKFRGCLLGGLMGDCLGYPFEDKSRPTYTTLQKFFDDLEITTGEGNILVYTDDTAMANCIAESLLVNDSLDSLDLAKRFVEEYFDQPQRYYGAHVQNLFYQMRAFGTSDPVGLARQQFNGSGSFGNGGAMRVAPVALYFHGRGVETLGRMAQKTTEVTHTHRDGINGAILQCLAIEQALWLNPTQPLDTDAFMKELIAKMEIFEKRDDESMGRDEDPKPFISRLRWALELLQREKSGAKNINEEIDVRKRLGSDVTAIKSVPTAIFCFLRAQQGNIPNINTSNPLRRAIQYAISLGGDTDTVACMAGAISGALLGYHPEFFNQNILKCCESKKKVMNLADALYSKCSEGEALCSKGCVGWKKSCCP